MYFIRKFNTGLSFLLSYILWSNIGPVNGQNRCLNCRDVFTPCEGSNSLILANEHDINLVRPSEVNDNIDMMKLYCMPHDKKIIGKLDDFVCFPQPRCYVVVSEEKWGMLRKSEEGRAICTKCGAHCGCAKAAPKKEGGASKSLNIEAFKWVIFIGFFTFIVNMTT